MSVTARRKKRALNDIEFMGKTVSLLIKGAVGMNRRITVKYCFCREDTGRSQL